MDDVQDHATHQTHTRDGTIGMRALVAVLMYQTGTQVPHAHGSVAERGIRRDTHATMPKHMSMRDTGQVWQAATKNIYHGQEQHGAND